MGLEETVDRRTKTVKDLLGDVDWNGNLEFPSSPTPEERDACCLAEYIDSILGTNASEFDFSKWIRDREMEQAGQYISQMTMSAMFLISVFSPCGNMHESEARKVADLYFNKLEQAGTSRVIYLRFEQGLTSARRRGNARPEISQDQLKAPIR